MKTQEELDEYLAGIRKTIAESEAMVQQAELRMAETDRLLAAQGLTREQVMNFRITAEQRRLVNDELKPYVRKNTRQHGGILAKGRLLGIQFDELLKNDLWLELAAHALDMAEQITKALREKGYRLYAESPTNQIFPVVTERQLRKCSVLRLKT